MRRLLPLALTAALACTTEVAPQNPYDPATPLPLQAKARIVGTVETGLGAPFAGLEVYLRHGGQLAGSFTTDATGAFVFDALTPGSYSVEAQKDGYERMSVTVQLAAGASIDVGALALLPRGGASTGTLSGSARLGRIGAGGVVEEDPAADNGGILIEAVNTNYAAVTTSAGGYALTMPPGSYTLRISHPNYIAQEVADQQVTLGATNPVFLVVLANNPAKVTGTVVAERLDGSVGPLADALVTLDGTSATGLTNAAGQFTLDQLAPGSYLLRVLKDGYATASAPVLDLAGGEERLLGDPLSLTLLRGGIAGRVVLADTPADASGVVVEVSGTGRAVVTGADGLFAFDGLVAGVYEVRARREGYAQQVVGGLAVTAGAVQGTGTLTLTRQGGTVAISEGAVTRARAVTLQLGAPSAASFKASEDPTFQDAALGDTTGTHPYGGPGSTAAFTLSDRDGAHQVYVVFVDGAGGASAPASASIVLDRLAPASPEVVVEAGGAFTRTATVRLTLSAQDLPAAAGAAVSGLSKMELADNSAFTGGVLLDYNLAHTWSLSPGDGLKAVYARFHDRAGNVSAAAVALVTLDTQPPQAPSLALSGGAGAPAGTTGSPLVTAALSATDANEGTGKQDLQVRLSNASGGAGAAWQPYAAAVSWLLPPGDGAKTVFAQFMDPAGNQSQEVQATITLAGTAPAAGSVTVAGGAAATRLQTVPVAISATGATAMRLYVDGAPVTGWIPYATSATVDLGATPDEATRLVSASFRNQAGVEGGAASDSIVFDQRAPTSPAIAVNGGAAFTKDLSVALSLSALDAPASAGGYAAGLDAVELADNAAFTGSTTTPYAASATWVLTGADGVKTIWARFVDRAGNRSEAVSAAIVLDTVGPASPAISLAGNAEAQAGATGTAAVTATLSAADANEGPGKANLQVRLSSDAGFAGAAWLPYAPGLPFTLPSGDGPKTVHAQFRDAAGNVSLPVSAGITLAATPPSAGSIVVEGGASATRKTTVDVAVGAAGAAQMRLFVNGAAATGWIPYATATAVALGAAPDEATRTVSVAFRSAGGLEGGSASASILLDQRAPTAPAVTVNGGAAYTGGLPVTLALSAQELPAAAGGLTAGLDTVELSNDAAFATSTVVPMVATLSWSLAAGADGSRTVHARFKDKAGNVSAAVSASVILDRAGPTAPSITLSGGAGAQAGFTATPVVTATLSATDTNEGAAKANLELRLGNDAGFSGSTWQPYATTASWVLPAGDGAKTVYAQFRDKVGNVSLPVSAGITLVSAPPTGGSLVLAGGAAATNQASVSAAVSAIGAAEMQFFVNGAAAGGWIPYATTATVALGAAPDEANRVVSVLFRSAGGVEGASAIASILFDQRAPAGGAVSVDGGATYAASAAVTLTVSANDGPAAGTAASGLASVEVSNDAAFAASTTFPYATTIPWTLGGGADGARTVHVRFRDKAGNVSAAASDGVLLDTAGPSAPSISLAGNAGAQAGYTGTPVVTATLSATDANEGAAKASLMVRLGNDLAFSGATWQPYATTLSWSLPGVDGLKTVYAQFKDAAGNASAVTSATITLAATPPTGGSISLASGAAATNQATVSAAVSAAGASQMRFLVDGVAGAWVAYATTASVALGAAPDEATRTVAVAFRNAGGVEGGGASTTILFDQRAPTGGAVSVNGGAAYAGTTAATLTLSATDGPAAGTAAAGLASVEVSNDAAFAVSTTFPYATSLPWTLASGADGARTVHVRFRDRAGNVSASASDAIVLDATGPAAPSISLAGNAGAQAGYTGTPVVTATLSATDANEGAGKAGLEVRLSNDSGFAGATWQPYAGSLPWSLPGTDGLKTVYAQFRDAAGNASLVASGTITLAATPPSAGSIVVAGGAAATNQTTVSAAVSATGASQMQFYVNGVASGGWVAYAGAASVDLGAAPDEATRTVAVAFRNAGGVEGGGASASILLDRQAPSAPAVTINGGAAYAASGSVTLALSASDGPAAAGGVASGLATVEVANNAGFSGSATYPMTDSLTWALQAGADGARTVHARFRDRAGNLSATATATVVLDATGPTAPTLALAGNPEAQAGYTGSAVVTATLSATDVNEGAGKANLQVRLSNDAGFAGASWQPYATSLPWVLPVGDGPKTVYAQFRDAAGNLSAAVDAPITLDATPPTGGAIAVAGGAAATNQADVTATISAAGAAQMQLYVNGTPAGGWIPYAGTAPVALGAAPDETTRTVSVVFRNFGGVEGGAAITSILLDQAAPAAPSVAVAGGAAYAAGTAVTLTLSASDGPTTGTAASGLDTVEVANDAAFTGSSTVAYATSLPWTLALGADGARTVYVRFRDKAGNVSATASDGVTLDTAGPTAPAISLAGNATAQGGYTGTPVVTATLSATDVNEGAGKANLQVRVSNDSGFSGASWQPYTTAMPWVLPIGDGAKTVYAQFRDAVGNVSLPVNTSITLAETPPSAGTIAVAGGAPATNQQSVLAALGATGAARMQLYVNGVAQPGGFVAYATSALVDLGLTPDESTRTVSVVFRNAGGIDGGDALTTIVMDRAAPTAPSVLVNGGASWTSPAAVTLAVSAQDGPAASGTVASGVASVEVANDAAFTGAATFGIADTVPWTLPGGDGAKTVYARFRDKAGNVSATASDGITLDTLGPTSPLVTMTGNTEASGGYTGTPVVTLALSATDVNEGSGKANLQVRVANDVGFSGVNWQPYTTSMQWVLPTGDGTKTVYAQFKDGAGNASATTSASIQLLATPPSGGSIVLAGGAAATAASSVTATISASNAATMRLSVNGAAVTTWIPYATSTSVSLAGVADQSTAAVTVSFRNLGGVEGGAATDSIRYDRSAPGAGVLAITGTLGNGTTSNTASATPAVTLSITPPGGDEAEMAVAQTDAASPCSGAFGTPLWQPVSRSASLVLSGVDGAKRACVVFRDAAGNWSAASAAAANVTLDTTPPTNPSFTNLFSRTQNAAAAPSSGVPIVTASTDATIGGVVYQCTGGISPSYGASWVDCATSTSLPRAFALSANTQSTLGVRARDAAHNYSPGSFVQILHDDVAPFPPFIVDLRASRDSATVTWDATGDTDVVTYLVHYGNSPDALTGTEAAQGPSPVQVPGVSGATTGVLSLTGLTMGLPYYVAVEAVDAAGNRSGKGGQRMVVPSKVNPRVLSAFGGQPRAVGVIATATKTYAYLAENQGLVQLDVSSDSTVPLVVGRAFLPDLVPDERAELQVFACAKGAVAGHCVLPTGTTLEGDYRQDRDRYRAPTPVVFFPLSGTTAAPAVGTIEALLPVMPHQVLVQTIAGEPYIYTIDRAGLRVFTFKAGQLSFLRQVAQGSFPVQQTAVLGATLHPTNGYMWVYAQPPPSVDTAPHLFAWYVGAAPSTGSVTVGDWGVLLDDDGNVLGDASLGPASPRPVPIMRGGYVFMAYRRTSTDSNWLAAYDPGGDVWPYNSVELVNLGSGSDYGDPMTGSGVYNNHVYVFSDWGMGTPSGTQVTFAPDLTAMTETAAVPYTGNAAFHVYSLRNHAGAERLFTVEEYSSTEYYLQRFTVSGASVAVSTGGPFLEIPSTRFVEADGLLYVAVKNRIFAVDAANPLTPNVVASVTGSVVAGNPYQKLEVHGRYLFAMAQSGTLDIFKLNGDGSLTPRHTLSWPVHDFTVAGHFLIWQWQGNSSLYVYNLANIASGSPTSITSVANTGVLRALTARFDGSSASAPSLLVYAAVANGAVDDVRIFQFNVNTSALTLANTVTAPIGGTLSMSAAGELLSMSNVSQTVTAFLYTPTSPSFSATYYPLGSPTLLQGGYLVGAGPQGASGPGPNGPSFLSRANANVEGTLRYSTCGDDFAATSLSHRSGLYAAGCQKNGLVLFSPVSAGGGRLLKSSEVATSWTYQSAALATDGMFAWLSGAGDASRLYTAAEGSLADGALNAPYQNAAYINNTALTAADPSRHAIWMLHVDGLVYVLVGGGFGSGIVPSVDVYDPGNWSTYAWTFLGRYTFATGDMAQDMATDGEYLYVARNNRLDVLDLRNPVPTYKTAVGYGGRVPSAVAVARDRVYVALTPSGGTTPEVRTYDVSNVATPSITANTTFYPGSGTITGLAVSGRTMALTFWDPTNRQPEFGLGFYRLGATNRDGSGVVTIGSRSSMQPLDSPVFAGDTLLTTSNLGLMTWDLVPLWRDGALPVEAGGVNLADPFRTGDSTKLLVEGPWAFLVGGTYRVFDLR